MTDKKTTDPTKEGDATTPEEDSTSTSGALVVKTNNNTNNAKSSVWDQLKRSADYVWMNTVVLGTSTKEIAMIKKLEYDCEIRKKKFGIDYCNLLLAGKDPTDEEVHALIVEIEKDLQQFQENIQIHQFIITQQKEEFESKFPKNTTTTTSSTTNTTDDDTNTTDPAIVSVSLNEK